MKITIKYPVKGKWSLSFGGTPRFRKDIGVIYNAIRQRLQARPMKEKTSILIKYDDDSSNETFPSFDPRYLLYTTGCFLEDFLSDETMKKIEKEYL